MLENAATDMLGKTAEAEESRGRGQLTGERGPQDSRAKSNANELLLQQRKLRNIAVRIEDVSYGIKCVSTIVEGQVKAKIIPSY